MASTDTLIDVINEVLRATGQRANKTAIAETDSTAYLRDRINDALDYLYGLYPTSVDADGSVTLPASTRTVNPPSGLDPHRIYNWSWRINNSAGDIPLDYVTEQYIIDAYPDFETAEAEYPQYVYLANNLLAFYPLLESGASSLTIQFKYPAQFAKLTNTSATFPFENRSEEMAFVKLYAQLKYEVFKALGQPGITLEDLDTVRAKLIAKYRKAKRVGFTGSRRLG